MVVIAADGRKLWFTPLEVGRARKALNQPEVKKPASAAGSNIAPLHEPDPLRKRLSAKPIGKTRDGMSELLVLPEELKYLEERYHDQPRKYQKPRPSNP
jgi:hypothetical protein